MKYLIVIFLSFSITGYGLESNKLGIKIYCVKEGFKNSSKNCNYCFDVNTVELDENPILDENDFENFYWKNQQIILNYSGKQKLKKIKIELSGLPVVMVLNNKRVYGFWFWNMFSSFGCDRVYTYPQNDFKIRFGLPTNNALGEDPRFNKILEKYVSNKYKQD
jgi:hypothetical protein